MARYCFLLQVRPELLAEYRERHAAVWPDMLRALHETGWRRYSLFTRPDGLLVGKLCVLANSTCHRHPEPTTSTSAPGSAAATTPK